MPSSPPCEFTGARPSHGSFEQTADRRLFFLTRMKGGNAVLKISGGLFKYLEPLFSLY